MAKEQWGGFAKFGLFLTGALTVFSIVQAGFGIYDRVTRPTSKLVVRVFASPYMMPEGFELSDNSKEPATTESSAHETKANRYGRVQDSLSVVTFLIENTGVLPAEHVNLSLSDVFTFASAEDEVGSIKKWRNPRTLNLETVRAGQSMVVDAWSPMPWTDMSPAFLVKRVSVTHDAGVAQVEPTRGPWAENVRSELIKSQFIPMMISTFGALCGGLLAMLTHRRRLRLKMTRLLVARRDSSVSDEK